MKKLDKMTYVSEAEKVISQLPLNKRGDFFISSNQMRNILTMINELYDMVRTRTEKLLSEDIQSHVQYVKLKLIYAAGRDKDVRAFLNSALLIEYMDSVGNSRDELVLLCHYTEALVAYHRYMSKN